MNNFNTSTTEKPGASAETIAEILVNVLIRQLTEEKQENRKSVHAR